MTRGPNWLFMDLGRRIERAHRIWPGWCARPWVRPMRARPNISASLLEIADSAMTYRSRYLNAFQLVPFVDLLLLDETQSALLRLPARRHRKSSARTAAHHPGPAQRRAAHHRPGNAGRHHANAHPARLAFCESGSAAGPDRTDRTRSPSSAGLLSDAVADAYFQHASRRRTGAAPGRTR